MPQLEATIELHRAPNVSRTSQSAIGVFIKAGNTVVGAKAIVQDGKEIIVLHVNDAPILTLTQLPDASITQAAPSRTPT